MSGYRLTERHDETDYRTMSEAMVPIRGPRLRQAIQEPINPLPVYIGIDVACGAGKPLPICVISADHPHSPLPIPKFLTTSIPRGLGNKEVAAKKPFRRAARQVVDALKRIEREMGWHIVRIAVDAPAVAPKAESRRVSEDELRRCRLSCFQTPSTLEWSKIRKTCGNHLEQGGQLARLPYANKIWMLFGFELFSFLRLRFSVEVIEVYPFAIVRSLLPACEHKSTEKGYRDQVEAVSRKVGWQPEKLEQQLQRSVAGNRHDRLDAFMAAWVASLPPEKRRAFGNSDCLDDAIWVPLEA